MQPRWSSRHLFPYAWTTATHWQLNKTTDYKRSRMLRHVLLPVCWGAIISAQSFSSKFKLAVFVYKSLYGLTPQYLVKDCELIADADRRQLWSLDIATFIVPQTYACLGDRAFPVAGPQLLNSLPSKLRQSDFTLQQFRWALKKYSFGWLWLQHLVTFVCSVLCKCSYLLTYLLENTIISYRYSKYLSRCFIRSHFVIFCYLKTHSTNQATSRTVEWRHGKVAASESTVHHNINNDV